MAHSNQLRENAKQHVAKNIQSKKDEKCVKKAMDKVIDYLHNRFKLKKTEYEISYQTKLSLVSMINTIKQRSPQRTEYAKLQSKESCIKPDGGILILEDKKKNCEHIILVTEVKKQGTNDERSNEGKPRQATGNAIERLGKNLSGIRSVMLTENIVPFVCFGHGCDFAKGSTILDRIATMNDFYPLNKTFVMKRDGFAPVSMYFRVREWGTTEMFNIMKEIAETAVRQYIH